MLTKEYALEQRRNVSSAGYSWPGWVQDWWYWSGVYDALYGRTTVHLPNADIEAYEMGLADGYGCIKDEDL